MNDTRIMIAEDDNLHIHGLKDILRDAPEFDIIATAPNGRILMQMLNSVQPDLLLLDIVMPQMDGIEAAQKIRAMNKKMKIVFVSNKYDAEVKKCIEAHNINGFICKGTLDDNIYIDALKRIVKGEKVIETCSEQKRASHSAVGNHVFSKYDISPTEKQILEKAAEGKATKVIAEELGKSTRTIDAHRERIFDKLDVKNMAAAIALAIREGLI